MASGAEHKGDHGVRPTRTLHGLRDRLQLTEEDLQLLSFEQFSYPFVVTLGNCSPKNDKSLWPRTATLLELFCVVLKTLAEDDAVDLNRSQENRREEQKKQNKHCRFRATLGNESRLCSAAEKRGSYWRTAR